MARISRHRDNKYTVIPNTPLRNRNMTLKAKGLLCFLFSLPDEWEYSITGLSYCCKEGKDSIRSAIRELENERYLVRKQSKSDLGRYDSYDYDLYETPMAENPLAENPTTENPTTELPTQINTKELNTNILNTKELKENIENKSKDIILSKEISNELPQTNNESISKVSNSKDKRFTKPTLEEVKDYADEINATFDVEYFYDYYEANGWRASGKPMKDWKATVRNWNRNETKRNYQTPKDPSKIIPTKYEKADF